MPLPPSDLPTRCRTLSAGALLVLATCSFPTDESADVFVTVAPVSASAASSLVLLRGEQLELAARVWRRLGPGDSVEVPNADVAWLTEEPSLATVAPGADRTGKVTGLNAGVAVIRALAAGFQQAESGALAIRVADPLEIDSVRPATVRYGGRVTLYGVGIREVFFAGLGAGTLIPDSSSLAGDPRGVSQMAFWVPPPAATARILVAGSGQLAIVTDPTVVLPLDLYEPNDTAPARIDLDGAPPLPAVPAVRFFNPALAREAVVRDSFATDWYRFSTTTPQGPHTFRIARSVDSVTFLADSAVRLAGAPVTTGWTIGSGRYFCKGTPFQVPEVRSDSLIVALKSLPKSSVDLVTLFTREGRYGITVVRAYQVTDPAIAADRFEENDTCDFADQNALSPTLRIDPTTLFLDTLSTDNPHDVDWYAFTVPAGPARTVSIGIQSVTTPGAQSSVLGDLDLYLLSLPDIGPVQVRAVSQRRGPLPEIITTSLPAGKYYIVVTDPIGKPTRYAMCVSPTSCGVIAPTR